MERRIKWNIIVNLGWIELLKEPGIGIEGGYESPPFHSLAVRFRPESVASRQLWRPLFELHYIFI